MKTMILISKKVTLKSLKVKSIVLPCYSFSEEHQREAITVRPNDLTWPPPPTGRWTRNLNCKHRNTKHVFSRVLWQRPRRSGLSCVNVSDILSGFHWCVQGRSCGAVLCVLTTLSLSGLSAVESPTLNFNHVQFTDTKEGQRLIINNNLKRL